MRVLAPGPFRCASLSRFDAVSSVSGPSMRRREFITLLAGSAASMPLATHAQQAAAMPVVGFLDGGSPRERTQQVAAFRKGLAEGGYQEGQNVALELRWAEGQYNRFAELAADLARRRVNVIAIPGSGVGALAAKTATATIPIVFGSGGNPVAEGLVASLNQPGGNLTGVNFFTAELVAKRMRLLRKVVPSASRIALLVNPTDPEGYQSTLREVRAADGGQHVRVFEVASARDIDIAFARMYMKRPTLYLLVQDHSSTLGVCSLRSWRHATRFRQFTPCVPILKLAA